MKKLFGRLTTAALAGGAVVLALRAHWPGSGVVQEIRRRAHLAAFEEHSHEALVHRHEHPHVTHNRREGADELIGEWEHLTATHEHEHNHTAITHGHIPHINMEHEHLGEAHIHDHSHPSES